MTMAMSITFKKICDDFGLTAWGVRHALEQYQILITELTDGFFSKLTYEAPVILDRARECFEKDMGEVEPVRRGKWIEICDTRDWQYTDEHYVCSGCLKTSAYKSDYCPKCGARMTEDAGVH